MCKDSVALTYFFFFILKRKKKEFCLYHKKMKRKFVNEINPSGILSLALESTWLSLSIAYFIVSVYKRVYHWAISYLSLCRKGARVTLV